MRAVDETKPYPANRMGLGSILACEHDRHDAPGDRRIGRIRRSHRHGLIVIVVCGCSRFSKAISDGFGLSNRYRSCVRPRELWL